MKLSFGFVAICLSEQRCSPAGNVTVKSVADLGELARLRRIRQVAVRNLTNSIRIMHFLHAHDIELYRMSAGLIPLATHEFTDGWAWWQDDEIRPLLARFGGLVRKHGYRVSSHLPEVCVLSTPDAEVFQWLERYLVYHRHLYEAMGLDETAKIILHIGGAYNDPEQALRQAEQNFATLDPWAQARIVLENDDKIFSAAQTLYLAERLGVPMVFDYHHHVVRNDSEPLDELIDQAFSTWKDRPPKVHLSSPKSAKQQRAHADYVSWEFAFPFFEALRAKGRSVDVMIEAKKKDLALIQLRDEYVAYYGR